MSTHLCFPDTATLTPVFSNVLQQKKRLPRSPTPKFKNNKALNNRNVQTVAPFGME